MAASDHLNPVQFYHASPHEFAPGDRVEPGHATVFGNASMGGPPAAHVYVTTSRRNAVQWARSTETRGYVYQVGAPVQMEPDPIPTGRGEYRTRESLPVIRKVSSHRGLA